MYKMKRGRRLSAILLALVVTAVSLLAPVTSQAATKGYGKGLTGSYISGIPFKKWKSASEYKTNVMYSNFRPVKGGKMYKGALYRSRRPDDLTDPSRIADLFMEDAGVKYVINLYESDEELAEKFSDPAMRKLYYYKVYKKGNVRACKTEMSFKTAAKRNANRAAMVKGFKVIAAHSGPYLVHCSVGKDRTGLFCVIAGALMGAEYSDLLEDYIKTYMNYGRNSTREVALERGRENLDFMLQLITYEPSGSKWGKMDLSKYAAKYLMDGGINAGMIRSIKRHLSQPYKGMTKLLNGNYRCMVKFRDSVTGKLVSKRTVAYGKSVKFPSDPVHAGYVFTGWSDDGKKITGDTEIVARFKKEE